MKLPKKPNVEPTLPSQDPRRSITPQVPSKRNSERDETRRANVLMEQMVSKFDAFGEAQSHIIERLDRMEPDLHAVKENVAVLKTAVRSHTDAIRANTDATRANTEVIYSMQTDLKHINQRLSAIES